MTGTNLEKKFISFVDGTTGSINVEIKNLL
jgi:hypothetical protein